jgi:hypothetical protein
LVGIFGMMLVPFLIDPLYRYPIGKSRAEILVC